MKTIVEKITKEQLNTEEGKKIIGQAGDFLKEGGLVAFPTDTVYGLGADALNKTASTKIYAAKGRPSDNPLIVHITNMGALDKIADIIPEVAYKVADAYWPGPLTMIFQKTEAAPSANTSGRPSPTKAEHVEEDLSGKIEMILDGGAVDIGVESTILDMTVTPPMILRPGAITKEMLTELIGEVDIDRTLITPDSKVKPKAPGMKYRHYAPKADLSIVEGPMELVIDAINQMSAERMAKGHRVGVIGTQETVGRYKADVVKSIGTRADEATIANHLYAVLREFDDAEVEYIYSESFAAGGIGSAIMNRLLKAAGHHVIEA